MEQQHHSIKGKIVLMVVLIAIAALLYNFSDAVKKNVDNLHPSVTRSGGDVTTSIKWYQIKDAPIIKGGATSTETTDRYNILLVLKIGDILEGQYKGNVVAMGITQDIYDGLHEPLAQNFYTYYYFIADQKGNPVAWDDNFFHVTAVCLEGPDCDETYPFHTKQTGLTKANRTSLAGIIPYAASVNAVLNIPGKGRFVVNQPETSSIGDSSRDSYTTSMVNIADTSDGLAFFRLPTVEGDLLPPFSQMSYGVDVPFGLMYTASPEPDFVDVHDVPQLKWTVGTTTVASYRYGQYAYGWQDCYDGITPTMLGAALLTTGKTTTGDAVYEIDAAQYPKVYQCLHAKTDRYEYDPKTQTGVLKEIIPYKEFVSTHPMFFWRHQTGNLMAFIRSDVVPAAEKAKPVIYLYPETTQNVSVKVAPIGGFKITDPEYHSGWNVRAEPNGQLTNLSDGKVYPYLFWEGGEKGIVETPRQGFVIAREDIKKSLDEKLSAYGLNTQERNDFLEFWVPKLSKSPYYFVTFIATSEIDRTAPMSVTPRPDTVIRLLMDYKPLEKPVTVEPLHIAPVERKGFTVVEWGGIIRD